VVKKLSDTVTTLRYAILFHSEITEPHFDLMFEPSAGSPLVTWRSPIWSITRPTELVRLADHRNLFLEFEGPLSGNRGRVKRVDGGKCQADAMFDDVWSIHFEWGGLDIRHRDGATWIATPFATQRS
jgi:hypothetical protein